MTRMELEWFNFHETPRSWAARKGVGPEPLTPGMFGYSLLRMNRNREFLKAITDEMLAFGIQIEGLLTETGPGVLWVAILFSEALEQADRAILFKTGVKEIGARFGIMPSFMAKPQAQMPACSGHIHQSLPAGKHNLFYDAGNPRRMRPLFESCVAGQVVCMMDFGPLIWPTINSYKRLVDGFWASFKPTWHMDNRTASFGVIAGSPKATRLETRCPGADVNPYLAMAAVIAAGLDGVDKGLKLTTPPITGPKQGGENIARAPRADRNHAPVSAIGHCPRMGMAAVAECGDRLGNETLFRNHLKNGPTTTSAGRRGCLSAFSTARAARAPRGLYLGL